ncbi:unnamed protein product [Ceratitis capitata]|uniref:(Mediterranean fruit fly) hypothetical protein n=1 Tax=Ceratitis capitata TaxID=7213 RepID=A0A811U059_CERCA|nr:unnamed protein product [Ceratitis capitata]
MYVCTSTYFLKDQIINNSNSVHLYFTRPQQHQTHSQTCKQQMKPSRLPDARLNEKKVLFGETATAIATIADNKPFNGIMSAAKVLNANNTNKSTKIQKQKQKQKPEHLQNPNCWLNRSCRYRDYQVSFVPPPAHRRRQPPSNASQYFCI